jgi:hypothetical protein
MLTAMSGIRNLGVGMRDNLAGLGIGVVGGGAVGGGYAAISGARDDKWGSRTMAIAEGAIKGAAVGGTAGLYGGRYLMNPYKYANTVPGVNLSSKSSLNEIMDGINDVAAAATETKNPKEMIDRMGAAMGLTSRSITKGLGMGINYARNAMSPARYAATRHELKASVSPATAAMMTEGEPKGMGMFAMMVSAGAGIYAGTSMSAANSGIGHPVNTASAVMGNYNKSARMNSIMQTQASAGIYMQQPYSVGARDSDDSYYTGAMRGSPSPVSRGQSRRFTAGSFNDDGNLVFALNTLRRG